jgi:hypothetical protein
VLVPDLPRQNQAPAALNLRKFVLPTVGHNFMPTRPSRN